MLSGLIWLQTVYLGHQQATKVAPVSYQNSAGANLLNVSSFSKKKK